MGVGTQQDASQAKKREHPSLVTGAISSVFGAVKENRAVHRFLPQDEPLTRFFVEMHEHRCFFALLHHCTFAFSQECIDLIIVTIWLTKRAMKGFRCMLLKNTFPASKGDQRAQRPLGRFIPALNEDDAMSQSRLLKALADPTRLRILSLLSRHEGEVCVLEMVESFTLEQPTISHHLRILRDAGQVDCRKRGLWAYYYVRREALSRAADIITGLA
jgi:ArsR family transcriptional regulator